MHSSRQLTFLMALVAFVAMAVGSRAEDHLPRPFTSEQIRDAWQPGLTLVMRQTVGNTISLQRWTVRAADEEGVEIEYADIDGDLTAEPVITRSTWIELRDHATFAAASGERSTATANTAFGPLEGWLYTISDDKAGTTTIFFFAESLPGAPVDMIVSVDGHQTLRMEMVERSSLVTATD